MLALPTTPFEIVSWAKAKVGRDCHAQVQNSQYSIPSRYVGQRLDVRIGTKLVRFYAGAELAKTHLRGKPGQRQTDWSDYPPEKEGLEPHAAEPAPPPIASIGAYLRGPEALFGPPDGGTQEIPA